MTEELFRDDATLAACDARITVRDDAGVQLDRTVFQVCPRRSNFDPPCRLNFDPGLVAGIA